MSTTAEKSYLPWYCFLLAISSSQSDQNLSFILSQKVTRFFNSCVKTLCWGESTSCHKNWATKPNTVQSTKVGSSPITYGLSLKISETAHKSLCAMERISSRLCRPMPWPLRLIFTCFCPPFVIIFLIHGCILGAISFIVAGAFSIQRMYTMLLRRTTKNTFLILFNHKNYNFLKFDWSINLCILY